MKAMDDLVYTAFFDGACEPKNPGGTASFGAIVYRHGTEIWRHSQIYNPPIVGETSNNIAEYCGLISVLEFLKWNDFDDASTMISGDSKLVIEQMSDRWQIRGGLYVTFARKAKNLLRTFRVPPTLRWIPREKNTVADELSKAHLIKNGIKIRNRQR